MPSAMRVALMVETFVAIAGAARILEEFSVDKVSTAASQELLQQETRAQGSSQEVQDQKGESQGFADHKVDEGETSHMTSDQKGESQANITKRLQENIPRNTPGFVYG